MVPPLLAIFAWPLAGIYFFKKLPLQHAVIAIIVAGYLCLPEQTGLNLPVVPTISKHTMPSFVALIVVLIATRSSSFSKTPVTPVTGENVVLEGWLPKHKLGLLLVISLLLGELLTALTNGDRLVYGPLVLPALSLYDGLSRIMSTAVSLIPLLLARKCLASPEQHKTLVFCMVIAGVLYALPTLWEARMSPQLSFKFYGIAPEAWKQHVRNGGFRPLVFLQHGLWLAIFMASAVIGAIAYMRLASPAKKPRAIAAAAMLLITLVLMNSLGALLIAMLLVLPVLLFGSRIQQLIATCLVVIVVLYPMLRGVGAIPVEQAISYVEQIDKERAKSLGFRLRNEDLLLEKASGRPLFGWGSWGRNQVYTAEEGNISTTDGSWIILIGSSGWVGYLSRFGLLCFPILLLTFGGKRYPTHLATTAVMMMLTANLLDLIPNATLTPITWLLGGALLGRLEYRAQLAGDRTTLEAPLGDAPDLAFASRGLARSRSESTQVTARTKPRYSRQKTRHVRGQGKSQE